MEWRDGYWRRSDFPVLEKLAIIFTVSQAKITANFADFLTAPSIFQEDHTSYVIGVEIIITFYIPVIFLTYIYLWHRERLDRLYEQYFGSVCPVCYKRVPVAFEFEDNSMPDLEPETRSESSQNLLPDSIDTAPVIKNKPELKFKYHLYFIFYLFLLRLRVCGIFPNFMAFGLWQIWRIPRKLIPFLLPFAFFHFKQLYQTINCYGPWTWLLNPISHFMVGLPLFMILTGSHSHFMLLYHKRNLLTLVREAKHQGQANITSQVYAKFMKNYQVCSCIACQETILSENRDEQILNVIENSESEQFFNEEVPSSSRTS